ncbi:MAG: MFS transporter [Deltaproteobacteria bacterium]|jgi:MFS family permease|nr:MFS transporter [Deltaproteobacteria bacterium]
MATQTKFKGWQILVCCFMVMFFVQGGIQCFAVFMPAIMKDTGFTLAQVALISTIATVVAFAANMSFGFLLTKLSAKIILFIGALICSINFFVISLAHTLFSLYFAAFCAGLAIGLGTVAPVSVIMTNWFVKNRATYMSLVIAGSMFGGAVLMPVAGVLIEKFDWRVANQIFSLAVLAMTFIAVLAFLTDHPAKVGQKAYGADEETGSGGAAGSKAQKLSASTETPGVTPPEARSSVSFWLLLAGVFLVGCSTNIENFLPTYWQVEAGMTVAKSASIMGFYALLTGVCAILLGRVSDKLGGRFYISLTTVTFLLGAFLIYKVGNQITPLVILAVLPFAVGGKKTSTLTPPLAVAEIFGRRSYGALIGYFAGVLQLGIAVSNPIIGHLFQKTGSFKVPFTLMGVVNVIALALVMVALLKAPYKAPKKTAT